MTFWISTIIVIYVTGIIVTYLLIPAFSKDSKEYLKDPDYSVETAACVGWPVVLILMIVTLPLIGIDYVRDYIYVDKKAKEYKGQKEKERLYRDSICSGCGADLSKYE